MTRPIENNRRSNHDTLQDIRFRDFLAMDHNTFLKD